MNLSFMDDGMGQSPALEFGAGFSLFGKGFFRDKSILAPREQMRTAPQYTVMPGAPRMAQVSKPVDVKDWYYSAVFRGGKQVYPIRVETKYDKWMSWGKLPSAMKTYVTTAAVVPMTMARMAIRSTGSLTSIPRMVASR